MAGMTFKIKENLTCGFAPGEVRAAHEFPPGTNFAGLVERGVMRPTDLSAMPPEEADKAKLMDDLEELTQQHAALQDDYAESLASHEARLKSAAEALADARTRLATGNLELEARDAELRRLQAELNEVRATRPVPTGDGGTQQPESVPVEKRPVEADHDKAKDAPKAEAKTPAHDAKADHKPKGK